MERRRKGHCSYQAEKKQQNMHLCKEKKSSFTSMTFGVVTTYLALISLAKLSPNMSTKYWKVLANEVLLERKSEVKLSKNAYNHVWERGADMRRKIKEAKRRKQIQNTKNEDQVEPMFVTAHQKRMNRLSSGIQNGRASESSRGARALNSLADSDPAAAAQGVMDVIGLGVSCLFYW